MLNLVHSFLFIPTHPLLWCTFAYIVGIIAGSYHLPLVLGLSACLLIISIIVALKHTYSLALILLIISFGIGHYRFLSFEQQSQNIAQQLTSNPLDIQAVVTENEFPLSKHYKQIVTLRIHSIKQHKSPKFSSQSPTASIRLYLFSRAPVRVGDLIEIQALSCKQPGNTSYEYRLFKEGIVASTFMGQMHYTLIRRPYLCFSRWRSEARQRLAARLAYLLSPSTYALVCTLFLGKKPPSAHIYNTIRAHCTAWGIVHYLARSGLHVVLIIYAWTLLLRIFPIHFFIKQLILIFLILLYHLLTWPSISFSRALITFLLYKLYVVQSRAYQPLHILTITTLFVLLANPLQLFFLDFQLSFWLAFALAWFNEVRIRINRFYI